MPEGGSICFRWINLRPCRAGASPGNRVPASGGLALQIRRTTSNLDARAPIRFAFSMGPQPMKTSLRLLAAIFVLIAVNSVRAGDFVSMVLQANQQLPPITVSGDHFLVIRNFTQEVGGFARGFVSVTTNGSTITNAFVASIEDPSPFIINDPVNNFVVAGPATVTVTCGDTTNCFITYRKGED